MTNYVVIHKYKFIYSNDDYRRPIINVIKEINVGKNIKIYIIYFLQ